MEKLDLTELKKFFEALLAGTLEIRLKKNAKKKAGKVGRPAKKVKTKAKPEGKAKAKAKAKVKAKAKTKTKTKAKSKGKAAAKSKPPRKVGRKALTPLARQKALAKAKRDKIRDARRKLPQPREVFEFLLGKHEGAKLSVLAKHFQARRTVMKQMLAKLTAKGDLITDREIYYLKRRIRKSGGAAREKLPPVKPEAIIEYLTSNPEATLVAMAKELQVETYQRLIKAINQLKKAGKVVSEGKKYRLA